jgi:hypothetical protein
MMPERDRFWTWPLFHLEKKLSQTEAGFIFDPKGKM